MFTGIIRAKGSITALERRGGDVRLSVQSDGLPFGDYEVGESICFLFPFGVCIRAICLARFGTRWFEVRSLDKDRRALFATKALFEI